MPLVEQELLTRQEHVFLCYPLFSFLYSDLWIIVCPFARFLLTIALSFLRFTGSDYPSRFLLTIALSFDHCIVFWPLHCLLTIALSFLRFTGSDYPSRIFWPLHCLLTIALSFDHCIVFPSIYGFWLSLSYLLTIALSFLRFTGSDCPIGIFKLFFEANQHQFP